jgi:indolepyruvate ferredoxin oxidoreductase
MQMIERRVGFLTEYKDAAWAARYREMVERVAQAESQRGLGDAMARAVARGLFKLMAHKDEWEVARLYSRPQFREELERTFEGDYRLSFHVAGGPFGKTDPATGKLVKREVGPWLMRAFRVMAPLRGLRDTVFDPFRQSDERRLARELLAGYETDVRRLLEALDSDRHAVAVKIAALPDKIRGYGHVRVAHAEKVAREREDLFAQWASSGVVQEIQRDRSTQSGR